MTKYTYKDAEIMFKQRGYVLISDESDYQNVSSKLKYICPIHEEDGIQLIDFGHLKTGRGCKFCGLIKQGRSRRMQFNYEEDKRLAESKGFTYVKTRRENGIIYIDFICNNHKDLGIQSMRKGNMKRGISGCQYCSGKNLPEEYVINMMEEINPSVELLEPYTNMTTRMQCRCKIHDIESSKTMQEILQGRGCYYCGIEKLKQQHTLTKEEIESNIHKRNPHVDLLEYNGAQNISTWICTAHNKEFTKCYTTLLNCDSGCELCYKEQMRNRFGIGQEMFEKRLYDAHPELVVLSEYINNTTDILVRCMTHDYEYFAKPVDLINRISCCDKTHITYKEEDMCRLIESWGYAITRQKTFTDCKDVKNLRFDCYLDDFNVVVEYDGENHFYPIKFGTQDYASATENTNIQKLMIISKMNIVKHIISHLFVFHIMNTMIWSTIYLTNLQRLD